MFEMRRYSSSAVFINSRRGLMRPEDLLLFCGMFGGGFGIWEAFGIVYFLCHVRYGRYSSSAVSARKGLMKPEDLLFLMYGYAFGETFVLLSLQYYS